MSGFKHFIDATLGAREYERHPQMVHHAVQLAGVLYDLNLARGEPLTTRIEGARAWPYLNTLPYSNVQRFRILLLADKVWAALRARHEADSVRQRTELRG